VAMRPIMPMIQPWVRCCSILIVANQAKANQHLSLAGLMVWAG
jgi:hypothetical protein